MGEARNKLLNAPNALRNPRVVGIEPVYPADHFSTHIKAITSGDCGGKYINLTVLDITATTSIFRDDRPIIVIYPITFAHIV